MLKNAKLNYGLGMGIVVVWSGALTALGMKEYVCLP